MEKPIAPKFTISPLSYDPQESILSFTVSETVSRDRPSMCGVRDTIRNVLVKASTDTYTLLEMGVYGECAVRTGPFRTYWCRVKAVPKTPLDLESDRVEYFINRLQQEV